MAEIDKLGRNEAVELAKKMRNKVRNLSIQKEKFATQLTSVAVGAGAAYAVGYWMGGAEDEYRANQAAIDAGQMEDPRKLAGIDKDLLLGGALALAGAFGQSASDKKIAGIGGGMIQSAGAGILAGYAYSRGVTAGVEAAQQG